jgi:hypothetical protein
VVKTIGILNILFGGVLLLCGLGCLSASSQFITGKVPMQLDPATTQQAFDEVQRKQVDDLRAREKAASSEEEKAKLAKDRLEAEAKHARVEDEIDFKKVNAELSLMPAYLRIDVLSGPLLNLLMIVSGIGLVLRQNWARLLGVWTALFKIVRLVALAILLIGLVIPRVGGVVDSLASSERGREVLKHAIEEQQAKQGQPAGGQQINPKDIVQAMRSMGVVGAIFFACIGSVYPIIALILLTRSDARAACMPAKQSDVMLGI